MRGVRGYSVSCMGAYRVQSRTKRSRNQGASMLQCKIAIVNKDAQPAAALFVGKVFPWNWVVSFPAHLNGGIVTLELMKELVNQS